MGPPAQGALTPSSGLQQPSSNYSQHSGSLPLGNHGQQQDDTHSNAGSDTPLTSMVAQMHSGDNNSETGQKILYYYFSFKAGIQLCIILPQKNDSSLH